jgi:hypothetical protein
MRRLEVIELLFTSDGQGSVTKSLQLRPASEVLITINLMSDNGGIDELKRLQVGVSCGVLHAMYLSRVCQSHDHRYHMIVTCQL